MLLSGVAASSQELPSQIDSISLGNLFRLQAVQGQTAGSDIFEKSPEADIAKAMYGQFSGLLVKQGTGRSEENQSKLRLHGHSPLIVIDGFVRELGDVTGLEIESVTVLKDASAMALYGVKGANGVVMIETKRGKDSPLKVTAKYQYGLSVATRTPRFANSYTYAYYLNQAAQLDGLAAPYNNTALNGFYSTVNGAAGADPYAYPNVDWWGQIFRNHGDDHHAQFTFTGGSRNFRYYAAVDYLKNNAMYVTPSSDDRYNGHVYDNRLSIRSNVDVNITNYTAMKIGVMARLSEDNKPFSMRSDNIEDLLYRLPAAAFPIKHADGTYGGGGVYGSANPVAQFQESGENLYFRPKVLADVTLHQDISPLVKGLSADLSVAFDYIGKMTETVTKEFQYAELTGGALTYYGTNSKTVDHSHWFSSLSMKVDLMAKLNYTGNFGEHHLDASAAYRQRSWIEAERNASTKTQEIFGIISYNWKKRVFADAVLNYSGSAYLAPGKRFNFYPALNVSGIISTEPYVKAFASVGLSGSDGDLEHELWRQAYGSSNGHSYNFGLGPTSYSGRAEGNMAALSLAPEQAATATIGAETRLLGDRLYARVDGFLEDRTKILIEPSNISGVLGLEANAQSLGEYKYAGLDLSLAWDDKIGDFSYGVYGNAGLLASKVIDDGQAFQAYEYLYHKGNPVGQCYGLEAIGFFADDADIAASPTQTFGEVRPGDIKYKDQNSDGKIDNEDRVKLGTSTTPKFQYGFGLHAAWKGFKVYADFQGVAGVTVSLLDSPLYQPLGSDGYTISLTYLGREIPWTPETAATATMPRLTTQSGANNYRSSSLYYRDGSFLKLRNLGISYTIPRSLMRICDATVSLTATNLFSADKIQFADPEQLGANYPTTRVFWAGIKFNF